MINFIRHQDLSKLQKKAFDMLDIPESEKEKIIVETKPETKKKGRKRKNV